MSETIDQPTLSNAATPPTEPTPRFRNAGMDRFFSRVKRKSETIEVEFEGEIFKFIAHEMSMGQKARFESMLSSINRDQTAEDGEVEVDDEQYGELKAKVICQCVTTEDGQPIATADEWEHLLELPGGIAERLFKASFTLSGIGTKDEAKQAETDAEKD